MHKFMKIKPSETTVDHRYNRDLDARRVEQMAASYDPDRVGVPVIAKRSDGSLVRVDGQHRIAMLIAVSLGDVPILMEVHDGLTLPQEANLFEDLNKSRKGINAIDLYRARVQGKRPAALEIEIILKKHHCKISKSPMRGGVMAVQAVESAFNKGNLDSVLLVLTTWLDGDPAAFEAPLLRAVSAFLVEYPDADPLHLAARLERYAPQKLTAKLRRESQLASTSRDAARIVLTEVYNHRTPASKRVGRTYGAATSVSAAQPASPAPN